MHLKFLLLFLSVSDLGAVQILLSETSSLKLLDSDQPSNITSPTSSSHLAIAVDYHYKRGEIYFSDGIGHIHRAWMRGESAKKDPLIIAEVTLVDGIAVDWVNDNLYWTDVSKKSVEMSNLDGLNRRILFSAKDDLEKPRAIVVDPSEGLLFWSDWGANGKVLSSGLDGKGMKIVASNFLWPNGLTLDLNRKKLYIIDGAAGKLSSCNYDGSNLKNDLVKFPILVQLAFGLTYYSDTLYWTSWKHAGLIAMNTTTSEVTAVYAVNKIGGTVKRLMGVKAVDSSLQPPRLQANPCDYKHCSHQCLPGYQGTASCMCPFGFTLDTDGKTCVEQGYMLVSWRKTIRRYDLNGTIEQPMIDLTKAAISLDYHYEKNLVFWSDVEEHRIYRAPLDQLNNKTIVATVENCDGLVVDWVHDVIYWTDTISNSLEAASLDGSNRTALITVDLDQPRALAVDPIEGKLFWSDWGTNPMIISANLDGSNQQVIARDDMVWPNGITIDYDQKRLYWVDGRLKTISSCLYDGSQRRQVLGPQIVSIQPFGISLLEDNLYWTDWGSQSVMKTQKSTQYTITRQLANSSSLYFRPNGIKIIHSSLQKHQDNPCMTIKCKTLCVGSPSSSRKARCLGAEGEPHTAIVNEAESEFVELDNEKIDVKNNSFQLSLRPPKNTTLLVISWKCIKREGCSDDKRCSDDDWRFKAFQPSEMPFTIYGLLPATKYKVKIITSTIKQEFHVTTTNTDPPELPLVKSVDVNGTNVTVKWDPVDTCVPNFESYNYKIYKGADLNQLAMKGSTNMTETTLTNLQPSSSYTMHLFTLKPTHFVSTTFETKTGERVECQKEEFFCDGNKDCSDGRDEDINVCAGIINLVVYKKTKSEVYFQCTVTNKTAKQLVKFSGNYSIVGSDLKGYKYFEYPAVPCTLWTDSYCFVVPSLDGNKMYYFNVSAVVTGGTIGNAVSASVLTKEGIPGPPEDLRVVSYNPTSVEIQWHHPNQTNGILRSFIINIHEVETFEEDKCCLSFPMTEAPVKEEEPVYSAKPGGFSPASTYAISITAKTLYLGGSKEIDVHTPPPPMEILRMPELDVPSLTPISWKPREDTPVNQPKYHSLIRFYLLLVIAPKTNQQMPITAPGSDIEIESPLKTLLEKKIGAEYSVISKISTDDAKGFKEPVRVIGLTPHKQYELVWVQVSQYKDVYGLDHIFSDPFIVV